jgi:hypothetical protein
LNQNSRPLGIPSRFSQIRKCSSRGGGIRLQNRPPNQSPAPQQPHQPSGRDAANQGRDAAVFAEEYRQWQETEAAIRSKEAELQQIQAELPPTVEAKQRAQAAVEALRQRSQSLGCGRFNAAKRDSGDRQPPSRQ